MLHMAVIFVYWQNKHEWTVSTTIQGSPLNISIRNNSISKKTKVAPPSHQLTEHIAAEHTPASKPAVSEVAVHDNTTVSKSAIMKASSSPASKSPQQQNEKSNINDNPANEIALLNNNMVDYLSSEFKVRFKYPVLARKRGWQGEVLINLDINRHGKIARIAVQRSSGFLILDHNAVATFRLIGEISPGLARKLITDHHLSIPVVYQLTDS